MPLNEGAVNEILPFAPEGLEASGDLLSLAEYAAHIMRRRGHLPGLALRELQNRANRQSAHMASGSAQFLANRHVPGILDDGDADKIEEAWLQVITALIQEYIPPPPDLYDVGQYYPFQDGKPRTGMIPLLGLWEENFSRYTDAVQYFESEWGESRLVTLEEYNARHVAYWHTNADGSKVGWDGEGGVNVFVWDKDADRMLVPDLAGMTWEQISSSLGVAGVHGDGIRNITGTVGTFDTRVPVESVGALYTTVTSHQDEAYGYNVPYSTVSIDVSRVVPTAAKNQPRAWGSLACVYLGRPTS